MCVSFDSSQYSEIIIDLLISIHTSIQQQHNINYILLVYLSQPIGNIVWNLSHNFVIFLLLLMNIKYMQIATLLFVAGTCSSNTVVQSVR